MFCMLIQRVILCLVSCIWINDRADIAPTCTLSRVNLTTYWKLKEVFPPSGSAFEPDCVFSSLLYVFLLHKGLIFWESMVCRLSASNAVHNLHVNTLETFPIKVMFLPWQLRYRHAKVIQMAAETLKATSHASPLQEERTPTHIMLNKEPVREWLVVKIGFMDLVPKSENKPSYPWAWCALYPC